MGYLNQHPLLLETDWEERLQMSIKENLDLKYSQFQATISRTSQWVFPMY